MSRFKHWIFLTVLSLTSLSIETDGKIIEFEKFVAPDGPWGRQPILLEDGAFSNLLIGIHADVQESDFVVEQIKIMFNGASNILFNTRKQYFREISILIPDNWKTKPEYEKSRPNETLYTARVIIRNYTSVGKPPSYPFVRRFGDDGEEGEYIYLPFGNLTSGYMSTQAEVIVDCWDKLLGGSSETSECFSSVEKDRTNTEEKNVIALSPIFRLLRKRNELSVVILDARQNMEENNKFSRMIAKFEYYVWHLFPTYSWLGVVVATNITKTMKPCLKIWESPGFRSLFFARNLVPQEAHGTSSLGDAVIQALQVLKDKRDDVSGCKIFVMSDGSYETDSNSINDVMERVSSAGVVLVSLPYSQNTSENIVLNNTINTNITVSYLDKMIRLEDPTRFSRILFYMAESDSIGVLELNFKKRSSNHHALIRIRCTNISLLNLTNTSGEISPEPWQISDGNQAVDILFYEDIDGIELISEINQNISLEVFSAFLGPFHREDASFELGDGLPQVRAILKTPLVNFTTLVGGVPLFAVLVQNERAVINMDLVEADVTFPDGSTTNIPLTHDTCSDGVTDDGSYSGYFNKFTTEGIYSFRVYVSSGNNACLAKIETDGCDQLDSFSLYTNTETFTVIGIPPSSITDITIVPTDNRKVRLEWTAPGADFMTGKAARYDIRFSRDSSTLHADFEYATSVTAASILAGNVTSPQDATTKEYIELSFYSEIKGAIFYVAIKTIDSLGNVASNISNVVKVEFTELNIDHGDLNNTSLIDKIKGAMRTPLAIISVCAIGVVICISLLKLRNYSKRRSARIDIFMRPPSRVSPEMVMHRSSDRCRSAITVDDF